MNLFMLIEDINTKLLEIEHKNELQKYLLTKVIELAKETLKGLIIFDKLHKQSQKKELIEKVTEEIFKTKMNQQDLGNELNDISIKYQNEYQTQ